MTSQVLILAATRKGLFVLRGSEKRSGWEISPPAAAGIDVNHATYDARTNTILATANDPWFGPVVRISRDLGQTWSDARKNPRFSGDPAPEEGDQTPWFLRESTVIDRLWALEPGGPEEPGVFYCGVAPAALFRSDDGGDSWQENAALSSHPTREGWVPGAGGMALHSIVRDPAAPGRMWVAVSAAGVFRTDDSGASWQTASNGIRSEVSAFDPNVPEYPEWGQCVHHIVHAAGANDRLYAQSHLGTYRSDNGGDSWTEITAGLPSEFGMAMAAHPRDPDTAYVVPLVGGEFRCPPDGRLAVWRTRDAGASWQGCGNGLPEQNAFMGVYRQALAIDGLEPAGLYLGTNTGQLYVSRDEGDSWELVTANLPPIDALSVAVIGA